MRYDPRERRKYRHGRRIARDLILRTLRSRGKNGRMKVTLARFYTGGFARQCFPPDEETEDESKNECTKNESWIGITGVYRSSERHPGAGMQRIGENSTFLSAPVRSDRPAGTERRAARNPIKRGGKEKEEERRKEEERSFKKKKKTRPPGYAKPRRGAARNKSRAPFTTKNDGGEEYKGAPLVPLALIRTSSRDPTRRRSRASRQSRLSKI